MSSSVIVEACGTDQVRRYHVRILLSTENALPYEMMSSRSALTPLGSEIATRLIQIPGVVRFSVSRYEVQLMRSQAFTWEEMEPQILNVLSYE